MDPLTISAANLDTLENNLDVVAKELNGVIVNVNDVNDHINNVESKVMDLNDEIKNLINEIKETTIITNARSNVMYNNSIIEKKFGYYDQVRRTVDSLLNAIFDSHISIQYLNNLKQEIILKNPDYWLANSLTAIAYWLVNDKENTYKEVNNSLKKNAEKTSLFFCLFNLKVNRIESSINWLNKYLSLQNPAKLDRDFIYVLNLITSDAFGIEQKKIVIEKIQEWVVSLNSMQSLQEKQVNTFTDFIKMFMADDRSFPYIQKYTLDQDVLNNNLAITNTYKVLLYHLKKFINQDSVSKDLDAVIKDLIYDYENNEQKYQKDNFKNNLIIECNGDTKKALELYEKEQQLFDDNMDLLSLFTNIVIYHDSYDLNSDTYKIALAMVKKYILVAYENIRKQMIADKLDVRINDYKTNISYNFVNKEVYKDLDVYLDKEFQDDDKNLLVSLIIINILGIISIFITLNNTILSTILIAILVISNILLFYKIYKRNKRRENEKKKMKQTYSDILERLLAEFTDYKNILENNNKQYEELCLFINNIDMQNYLNNNDRNLSIGE